MTRSIRRLLRLFGVAFVAVAPVVATTGAAHAQSAVTYNLQSSALGQTANSTLSVQADGTAPASVAAGAPLRVALSVGSITVPTSASGYTIKQIQNIVLKLPVPSNSTYVSSALSGGSGYGSGTPTVSVSSGVVSTLSGTGYSDPGLTFTAVLSVFGFSVNANTVGYPTAQPALTSTTIS